MGFFELRVFLDLTIPVAVFVMMTAMGLNLRAADIAAVLRRPKSLIVATALQILLLPPLAVLLAWLLDADPVPALVLIAIAASPGGVFSNVYVHFIRGNLALSVAMTLLSTVLMALFAPWVVSAAAAVLGGVFTAGVFSSVELLQQLAGVVLFPLCAGAAVSYHFPALAARARRAVDAAAGLSVLVVLVSATVITRTVAGEFLAEALLFSGVMCAGCFALGRAAACLLPPPDRSACVLEFGLRNLTVALLLASGYATDASVVAFLLVFFVLSSVAALLLGLLQPARGLDRGAGRAAQGVGTRHDGER